MNCFYLEFFLCTSTLSHVHYTSCVVHIFIKFQDNTSRNKVEIIMETQAVYLLINIHIKNRKNAF